MFKKRFVMGLAVAATMAIGTSAAQASPLNSFILDQISSYGNDEEPAGSIYFTMEDTSRETLIKWNEDTQSYDEPIDRSNPPANTNVEQNDRLRGIFRFDNYLVEQGTSDDGSLDYDVRGFQVTGVFDVVVESAVEDGGDWSYSFSHYDGFASELAAMSNVDDSADLTGTMAAIFASNNDTFDFNTGDFATDFDSAVDGSPWAFLGFTGQDGTAAAGEGWTAETFGGNDVTGVGLPGLPAGSGLFSFNRIAPEFSDSSALSFLQLPSFFGGGGETAEFTGEVSFESQTQGYWPVSDDFSINMNVVPTPTASLAGLMAFGMIAAAYRRRTGKAELATA